MTAFEQAFAVVIGLEGGFDTTRADPGNWTGGIVGVGRLHGTKYGVSAAAYPNIDIANLTLAAAQTIYRRDYWDRVAGDELPPSLALLVFDAAVNNGPSRAIRWLEAAVGASVDSGTPVIGPETKGALDSMIADQGEQAVCAEFHARRVFFMGALATWPTFGLGWSRRLCALPYQSIQMETANAS